MGAVNKAKSSAPAGSVFRKYAGLLSGAFAFLVFANSIANGYNMDDELVTGKHKLTTAGLKSVGKIFSSPYFSDSMGYAFGYRPMVLFSYALEHELFGVNPQVSHFFNVLLYALSVMVFFRLILRLTGEKGFSTAVVASVLFAVHPVHTEVVNSLKNRDEILAFLFSLLAGLYALKATAGKGTIFHFLASFLFFTAGMLSKKSIFPVIFIFPLALFMFRRQEFCLKRTVSLTALWTIPGVLLTAADLQLKTFLLLLAPVLFVFILHTLLTDKTPDDTPDKNSKTDSVILWTLLAAALVLGTLSFLKSDSVYWFSALFLAAVITFAYPGRADFVLPLFLAAGAFLLGIPRPGAAACVMALIFMPSELSELKKIPFRVTAFVSVAMLFLAAGPILQNILFVTVAASAHFLFAGYRWAALGLLAGAAVFFLFFGQATKEYSFILILYIFYLLTSGLKTAFLSKAKFKTTVKPAAVMLLVGISLYASVGMMEERVRNFGSVGAGNEAEAISPKPFIREGRMLEYVENTLIAPHTKAEKIATGAITLGEYLRLMVFPYELSFYYGFARIKTENLSNPSVWIILAIHLSLLLTALLLFSKKPVLSFGILWYLFGIMLFSNWVELVAGMVGERLAYLASAGFCLACAGVFHLKKERLSFEKPALPEFFLSVLVLLFVARTVTRNSDWKDAVTLMGRDIAHLSRSAQANNVYASNLMNASADKKWTPEQRLNMRRLAIYHFDRALEIWPQFFNAAYDKGRACMMISDTSCAIDGFEKAVAMNHKFKNAYISLADLYIKTGQASKLLRLAGQFFNSKSEGPEKYDLMARAHYMNGNSDSAKIYLRLSIQLFPHEKSSFKNLSEIFRAEGRLDSAEFYGRLRQEVQK